MAVAKEDIAGAHSGVAPVTHAHEYGSIGRWLVAPALIYAIVVTQLPFVLTALLQHPAVESAPARNRANSSGSTITGASCLDDSVFRDALVNTLIFTFGAVTLSLLLGLFYAELVNHRFPGRGIVRTMLITPFLVMPVAGALGWKNHDDGPGFRGHRLAFAHGATWIDRLDAGLAGPLPAPVDHHHAGLALGAVHDADLAGRHAVDR